MFGRRSANARSLPVTMETATGVRAELIHTLGVNVTQHHLCLALIDVCSNTHTEIDRLITSRQILAVYANGHRLTFGWTLHLSKELTQQLSFRGVCARAWVCERMSVWASECLCEQVSECVSASEWVCVWVNEYACGCVSERACEWMSACECASEWVCEWACVWMCKWVCERVSDVSLASMRSHQGFWKHRGTWKVMWRVCDHLQ